MKNQLKLLGAVALFAVSATASATTYTLYLQQDGYHSASAGSAGAFWLDGTPSSYSDTWSWDSATGILTQGANPLNVTRRSPASNSAGTPVYSDAVSGLSINTTTGAVSATSYSCTNGTFLAGTTNNCGNYNTNGVDESTMNYNFGGSADCLSITTGGNDGLPGWGPLATNGGSRGLTQHGPTYDANFNQVCNGTVGAYDMTRIFQDSLGSGGTLTLWNAIGVAPAGGLNDAAAGFTGGDIAGVPTACVFFEIGSASNLSSTACNGAHWLKFGLTPIPVPGAVWLFGSALGLLGLRRRAS